LERQSFGRNSKNLFNWCRSQINIAPADPDEDTLLIVTCGKNNNGRMFEPIAIEFSESRGLYVINHNFDMEEYKQSMGIKESGKRKPEILPSDIAQILWQPMTWGKLVTEIRTKYDCTESKATRLIAKAAEVGHVIKESTATAVMYKRK